VTDPAHPPQPTLAERPAVVRCDVAALPRADLGTIDALARLQVAARRQGATLELRNASSELRELLDLVGLCGALGLRVGARGKAEEREETSGVQKKGDPADGSV
jgi:hypothetical protein